MGISKLLGDNVTKCEELLPCLRQPAMDPCEYPIQGEFKYSLSLHTTETGDKRRPDGPFGSPNFDWGQSLPLPCLSDNKSSRTRDPKTYSSFVKCSALFVTAYIFFWTGCPHPRSLLSVRNLWRTRVVFVAYLVGERFPRALHLLVRRLQQVSQI